MRTNRQFLIFLILGTLGFGLSFTRLSIFGLLVCIGGWLWVSQLIFRKRLYGSYLTHFILGFLLFCVVSMLVAAGLSIMHQATPLWAIAGINLGLSLAIAYRLRFNAADDITMQVKPHWILISISIVIISLFTAPIIARPTTANLLRYSMYGYDDAAHMGMFRADVNAQGVTTKVDTKTQPNLNLDPNVPSYPQGFHASLAILARGVFQLLHTSATNVRVLLLSYRIGAALFYSAIVILLIEVMAQLAGKLRAENRKLEPSSQLYIGITVLLIYATLIFPEIAYAGQSFLTTVAMVLAVLLSTMLSLDATSTKRLTFAVASLFAIGAMYTWILSAIVAFSMLALGASGQKGSAAAAFYWRQLRAGLANFPYRRLLGDNWAWVIIALAGLLCIPQALLLLVNSKLSVTTSLNLNGGIAIPDQSRYIVLLIGIFVVLLLMAAQKASASKQSRRIPEIGLLFLCPLVMVLFFYTVQTLTTGQLSYYYVKATYLADITIVALTGVAVAHVLHRARATWGTVKGLAMGLVVFGTLAMYLSLGKGFLGYAHGSNPNIDTRLTAAAGQLIDSGVSPKDIVSYTGRSYEEDMYFNLFTGQLDQISIPQRHLLEILAVQKRYTVMKKYIGYYSQRSEKTYILVSRQTEHGVKQALPANGNYRVIVVE